HDAVVGLQPVRMDGGLKLDPAADNRLKAVPFTVGDNLRVNAAVALVDAEDDGLAPRPAAALATHPASTELGLIEFDLAAEGRRALPVLGNGPAYQCQIAV